MANRNEYGNIGISESLHLPIKFVARIERSLIERGLGSITGKISLIHPYEKYLNLIPKDLGTLILSREVAEKLKSNYQYVEVTIKPRKNLKIQKRGNGNDKN